MVQGQTLGGMIADCGDVLDNPRLKDMLAAYVALTRVKKADNLLLLRAFSPQLFQQGPPPGPHCLMKLLRSKCHTNSPGSYTLESAEEEYEELCKAREESKLLKKKEGLNWQCSGCKTLYGHEAIIKSIFYS